MALSGRRSEVGLKNCSFALRFSKREQRKKCLIERALVLDEKQFPPRLIEMQIIANLVVRIHQRERSQIMKKKIAKIRTRPADAAEHLTMEDDMLA